MASSHGATPLPPNLSGILNEEAKCISRGRFPMCDIAERHEYLGRIFLPPAVIRISQDYSTLWPGTNCQTCNQTFHRNESRTTRCAQTSRLAPDHCPQAVRNDGPTRDDLFIVQRLASSASYGSQGQRRLATVQGLSSDQPAHYS